MTNLLPSIQGLLDQLNQAPKTDIGALETAEKIAAYLEGVR